jgi:hypothetical protein
MGRRWVAAIALAYVATRVFGMVAFAPHNDEVLYADAAQQMAADWETNRWLFQNGRLYGEYKEPLQYWLDALTVNLSASPVVNLRLWSFLLGFVGLAFLHRFAARVWSEPAANATALLVVFSEFFFYFDSIALNEAFLYGLGTAYLYFSYDFLEKRRWGSGALSVLILVGVLSVKATGAQWIAMAAVLPLLVPAAGARRLGVMALQVAGVALLALALHARIVPAEFDSVREAGAHQGFVRTVAELFELPVDGWLETLSFYGGEVLSVEFGFTALPALALVAAAAVLLFRSDRPRFVRYLVLMLLYGVSIAPVLLMARVHFVRYFGVGLYTAYLLIGIAAVEVGARVPSRRRAALAAAAVALLLVWKATASWVPLVRWGQTELAIRETRDPWARGNGIPELLDRVSRLEAGVLVADAQWGHPGTALKIHRESYPQLTFRLLSPVWWDDPVARARAMEAGNLYYVLDARYTGERPRVDAILRDPVLCAEKTVIHKRWRGNVLEGSALVLCQARL